jgi:hypothetical protein
VRIFLEKNEYREVGWCKGEGWCPHSTSWILRGLVSSSFVSGWCLRGLVSSLFATDGFPLSLKIINCKLVLVEEHK